MKKITISELIDILEDIEDKSQEVEIWAKSDMKYRRIEFICENACGGLDIIVE